MKTFVQSTSNILVSVNPSYSKRHSQVVQNQHLFAYEITIENNGPHPVKLLERKWSIKDICQSIKEVQGPGVIGIQPVIFPEMEFFYQSNVVLNSGYGQMWGYYTFLNLTTGERFVVEIPKFDLIQEIEAN